MGQSIEILKTSIVDDVAMFDTDRSLTGQDGHNYTSLTDAEAVDVFPAQLSAQLFSADASVNNVYLFSNAISVSRLGGWDDESSSAAGSVIRDFFVVYDENKG